MRKARIFLLLIAIISYCISCNSTPRVRYFRHYQSHQDGYKGIYEISKDDAKWNNCYRLIYDSKGKVRRIDHLRLGILCPMDNTDVARIAISDSANTEIIKYFDKYDFPVAEWYGAYAERILFYPDKKSAFLIYYDKNDMIMDNTLGYSKENIYFNDDGLVYRWQVLSQDGVPIESKFGFCDIYHEFDSTGNPTVTENRGLDGKPLNIENYGAKSIQLYNEKGYLIEKRFYAADGNLVNDSIRHYPIEKFSYDSLGNEIEISMCDSLSIIRQARKFDLNHWMIEVKNYDKNGILAEDSIGGPAIIKFKYNNYGIRIETAFYDTSNNLTADRISGAAIIKRRIDPPYGFESYYDTFGKPTDEKEYGCAKISKRFDSKNRLVEENYFDGIGRPKECRYGFSLIRYVYDELNRKIEERYYGKDNRLKNNQKNKAAVVRFYYDEKSDLQKIVGYDINETRVFEKNTQSDNDTTGNSQNMNEYD